MFLIGILNFGLTIGIGIGLRNPIGHCYTNHNFEIRNKNLNPSLMDSFFSPYQFPDSNSLHKNII